MSVLNKLALSPFEWSMSDRISASPMEFVVRLDCVGIVDVAKFLEAILAELKRQPILQANTTVGQTHRESFWRAASNCTPEVRWYEGNPGEGSGFPGDFVPIDLENEIGFRFYGWRFPVDGQPQVVMKFVYHHACCDGKGGIGFVDNVLHRYQSLLAGESASPSDLTPVDSQQIFSRNLPAANKLGVIARIWRALVIRPRRVGSLLLSKPRVFAENIEAANSSDKEIFADPPRKCSTELSVDETKQLGAFAKERSASSNTVLARELFHVLNDYFKGDSNKNNSESSATAGVVPSSSNRDFRMLIPFSLRDERHAQMPAVNCVSMAYLETNEKVLTADSEGDPVLLFDLVRQVKFIRRWNLQYSWIESIDSYSKIWPLIWLFRFRRKGRAGNLAPVATTVMTNLGRAFVGSSLLNSEGEIEVNSMTVKSVHVAPPCNATVVINFSINFYGNRLPLDANYLPSKISQATAEGLLRLWKCRMLAAVSVAPNYV